jgi:hypothetical protein
MDPWSRRPQTMAFTDRGLEYLQEILAEYKKGRWPLRP